MKEKEDNQKYREYDENYGIDLAGCQFLGEGNHGKVFLISNDRIIKIFRDSKSCIFESFILNRINGNKHFPRIYDYDENYIIRDYVGGECLRKYIKKNGLSKGISISLINLCEEFKTLGFKKIDIRCRDIMIQEDGHLMVIDPKGSFTRTVPYPRHLMKGLKSLGVLDLFIDTLREERPDLYEEWKSFDKKI
jgi:predicted Ser/Thr protein kinase